MQDLTNNFRLLDSAGPGHGVQNDVGFNGDFRPQITQFLCHGLSCFLLAEVGGELLDVAHARIRYLPAGDFLHSTARHAATFRNLSPPPF
jgi:hypothetical protein